MKWTYLEALQGNISTHQGGRCRAERQIPRTWQLVELTIVPLEYYSCDTYKKFIKADLRFIHSMGIKRKVPFCTWIARKKKRLLLVLQNLSLPAGVELVHTSLEVSHLCRGQGGAPVSCLLTSGRAWRAGQSWVRPPRLTSPDRRRRTALDGRRT